MLTKENAIPILKEIMKRHLRNSDLNVFELDTEDYLERMKWDKGNKNFWSAKVGGKYENFTSIVDKLTKDEFKRIAEQAIYEELKRQERKNG